MGNKTVGRMIQILPSAQILLAATNGGVYRSTNAGATGPSPCRKISEHGFKPDDPNIVYAAASVDVLPFNR